MKIQMPKIPDIDPISHLLEQSAIMASTEEAEKTIQEYHQNIARTANATESINNKVTDLASDLDFERNARKKGDKNAKHWAIAGVVIAGLSLISQFVQWILSAIQNP